MKPELTRVPLMRPALVPLDEIREDMDRIWKSGRLTCGPYTRRLEETAATLCGRRHAVAVSSCTAGLTLAARALELRGRAIIPAFTFAATAHGLVWQGLEPVFCDVDPETGNLTPEALEQAASSGASVAVPVYIFGTPPEWDALLERAHSLGLVLLADAAQALGGRYRGRPAGSFAKAEVFSLSPSKVVSSLEGGLVVTDDDMVADRVRRLRDYGKSSDGNDMDFVGMSARMSEVHALVGCHNLVRLEELIDERLALVDEYRERLEGIKGLRLHHVPSHCRSTANYAVIYVGEDASLARDTLQQRLARDGIETKRYFYPALHKLRAYAGNGPVPRLPVAEQLAAEGLALPLWNGMSTAELDRVSRAVREALGA